MIGSRLLRFSRACGKKATSISSNAAKVSGLEGRIGPKVRTAAFCAKERLLPQALSRSTTGTATP
jgi:hypothetical protein